jgi:phospho-N-acetylmuramoyl-pentapeptide-transferase
MKSLKVGQPVLHYVEEHKNKSGTPTMGGVAFILPLFLSFLFAPKNSFLLVITVIVTAGYGIVGFLDDFIKVRFKRNDGLSALQKIIFQTAIATIVSIFAFLSDDVGGVIYSPFTFKELDLGLFSVPLYVFIFLSFTNSVNLTDGLDGLASGVSVSYLAIFAGVLGINLYYGNSQFSSETSGLIVYCCSLLGSVLAFLCYNTYPAKIFMGDTGSLALGGGLACLAIFSKRILLVPIIGIMFIVSSLSVILQVLHFKRTKKRIFLMAPIHHHFQEKGVHESKISFLYSLVTFLVGICSIAIMLFAAQ